MIRVKICGITSIDDASKAVAFGADAIGVVFADSPRRIDILTAGQIIQSLPPFVTAVGLFVNEDPSNIITTVRALSIDVVQLHGDESPETVQEIANHCRVIKALRIRSEDDFKVAEAYAPFVSAYLFDAYVPGIYGGTGQSFNWNVLKSDKFDILSKPWILAGGLTPDNVSEAVALRKPYAVDVSSGVESEPGKKDRHKIKQFMLEVER